MTDTRKIYEEKIIRIFGSTLEYNGNHRKVIEEVKTWLHCEWQCGMFEMDECVALKELAEQIAERMIKEL